MLRALKLQRSEPIRKAMRDDKEILLDGDSYRDIVQMDHPVHVSNEEQQQDPPEHVYMSIEEQPPAELDILQGESRFSKFLHNWNSVGICLFYNLCMIVLVLVIFIYKRKY
ncbi:uncharacterized protein [Drosophila pseudoobscura]|uniref:Uncharacterized protein n=1 Tax=Drosophila pseudoobscura pseudoobscura TaxID=46245 RepID=A0A6I8V948_DROPS|nr:uncharacterized protein LOC26533270 [Drosophila pseudoobscura]